MFVSKKTSLAISSLLLIASANTSCSTDDGYIEKSVMVMCECVGYSSGDTVRVEGGKKVELNMTGYSNPGNVTRMSITYQLTGVEGTAHVADTTFTGVQKTEKWRYVFTVPEQEEQNVLMRLRVDVWNTEGDQNSQQVLLKIKGGNAHKLEEIASGVVFYAKETATHCNSFSIYTGQVMKKSLADSASVDIYVNYLQDATDISEYEWRSNTGLVFARTTSDAFNYAGATNKMLKDAYGLATTNPGLRGVTEGDIVLVGKEDEPLGVILVTQTVDLEGSDDDRYVVNIKLLK